MFSFTVQRSLHYEGTKYYQVISILDSTTGRKRGVSVTHWGSYHPGALCTPLHHGQSKVVICESGAAAESDKARRNKEKRGYNRWEDVENKRGLTDLQLRETLNDWFKAETVKKIMGFLDCKTWHEEASDAVEDSDYEMAKQLFNPIPAPVVFVPEPVRGMEWGTW